MKTTGTTKLTKTQVEALKKLAAVSDPERSWRDSRTLHALLSAGLVSLTWTGRSVRTRNGWRTTMVINTITVTDAGRAYLGTVG